MALSHRSLAPIRNANQLQLLTDKRLTATRSFPPNVICTSTGVSVRPLASVASKLPLPKLRGPLHGQEATGPEMRTAIPGPKSLELKARFEKYQHLGALMFFADYQNSFGNYVRDCDGNRLLDMFAQIASLPLGYNHPDLIECVKNEDNLNYLVQRPSLACLPPADWVDRVEKSLLSVAPKGLSEVTTMMCGSCSIENALKLAFITFRAKQRGGGLATEEDLKSCMENAPPGSPELRALAFRGGFHGRTFGALSCTRSKAVHKVDIPALPFLACDFPKLKYPLSENAEYNKQEEERCLAQLEAILEEHAGEVAVAVIEPIQAEGGDNEASISFFRGVRKITEENGVLLIVDEVQTGGGPCGRFWAHEEWYDGDTADDKLSPPDFVTFSKKLQTGGFFTKKGFRPQYAYQIMNTWMGDPHKMVLLEAVLKVIKRDKLIDLTQVTGKYMLDGMKEIEKLYPTLIGGSRGKGTFLAADIKQGKIQQLVQKMRNSGVNIGSCGEHSLRIRPTLTFGPEHASIFLNKLESSLKNL